VCMRERERVIWTDILDIQFPDAENKHDSKNVDLFTFQTPDGACDRSFFFFFFFFWPPLFFFFFFFFNMEIFFFFFKNCLVFFFETFF